MGKAEKSFVDFSAKSLNYSIDKYWPEATLAILFLLLKDLKL